MSHTFVLPIGALGAAAHEPKIVEALRKIAVAANTDPHAWPEKYGTEVDNPVFSMQPYCWCEKSDCAWCRDEPEPEPNFWYKPTGTKIWWYKYIGREMRVQSPL